MLYILAAVEPVHKSMRDKEFVTEIDSSQGRNCAKKYRSQFKLGRWSFLLPSPQGSWVPQQLLQV